MEETKKDNNRILNVTWWTQGHQCTQAKCSKCGVELTDGCSPLLKQSSMLGLPPHPFESDVSVYDYTSVKIQFDGHTCTASQAKLEHLPKMRKDK